MHDRGMESATVLSPSCYSDDETLQAGPVGCGLGQAMTMISRAAGAVPANRQIPHAGLVPLSSATRLASSLSTCRV